MFLVYFEFSLSDMDHISAVELVSHIDSLNRKAVQLHCSHYSNSSALGHTDRGIESLE